MTFFPRLGRRRTIRLWGPVFAIVVASVIAAVIASSIVEHSANARAADGEDGDYVSAARAEWRKLQSQTGDLETWVRFIEFRARSLETDSSVDGAEPLPDDREISALLPRIQNAEVREVATFCYLTRSTAQMADIAAVTALADRNPPLRLANFVLGRDAMRRGDWATAARRFEREAISFEKSRERNLHRAVGLWVHHEAWDEIRKRARDPRFERAIGPPLRLELAVHDRDWAGVVGHLIPAVYSGVTPWPAALGLLAAVLWFVIAARLGRIQDGVAARPLLYALAFILGVLSVYPTLITAIVEETLVGLEDGRGAIPDAIYYVFGVGLREELWKLVMFLPLLRALKRRGSRIEAMTCGALVGLGFAAEENLSYFRDMDPGTAISRFMTANFLHMALTSLVALSVYDTSRGRATSSDRFDVVFPLAVGLHGAYDLFIASEAFRGLSILSMVILIVLTQRFLRQLLIASSTTETQGLMRLVVWSLTLLAGASYVYASTLVGPLVAVALISVGLLGVAILVFMFVRELA